MKVTVVLNESGKVIAAHVPVASERGRGSYTEGAASTGFLPAAGQEVLDLDLPDEDVPGEPPEDFLEALQKRKDEGGA